MVFRLDFGTLGTATRTPQGGLAIPADLTRAGVFSYAQPDGTMIREWRPRSEVFRKETLDSLKNAPFTLKHPPPGEVNPDNYSRYAKGHVGSDVRQDGDKTAATVYAQDKALIRAIEVDGWREVSCGYHCDADNGPGIVPEGEPDAGKGYDRVQRNILYNHNALVPHGRAGTGVRLRLDAQGDAIGDDDMPEPTTKTNELIDGVTYEVGSDAHRAARTRQDAADEATAAEVQRLRADHAEMKGKLDAAIADRDKIVEGARSMLSPERLDARAAARQAIVEIGRAHLGRDFKADGLTNREIKLKVLAKLHPAGEIASTLRADSADAPVSGDYIKGLWASVRAEATSITRGRRTDGGPPPALPGTRRLDSANAPPAEGEVQRLRNDAMEESEQRWSRPLTFSRGNPVGQTPLQQPMIENQR